MRYLSVCSGIEAASVAWGPLGWKAVGVSEIEPFPCSVLKHHYPDVPNFGDMTQFEEWDIEPGSVDVLVGGTPCFPGNVKIITKRGFVPIKDVVIGDEVLTHKQQWKKVVAVGGKNSNTIRVSGQGQSSGIETTEDHPFYSRMKSQVWVGRENGSQKMQMSEPDWTPAKNMKGMMWASPSNWPESSPPEIAPKGNEQVPPQMSKALAWVIGRWIGDGWCRISNRRSYVLICCGKHEADYLASKITESGLSFSKSEQRTSIRFQICNSALAKWIAANFGSGAKNKTMPPWVFGWEHRSSLFEGYLSADGCVTSQGRRLTTISDDLALSAVLLAQSLGFGASRRLITPKRGKCFIEGREVSEKPSWQVTIYDSSRSSLEIDGIRWGAVRKVEPCGFAEVFNLEVEDDNSYAADGIFVHNCQSFSIAGLRGGLEDGRGNLALTYCRILQKFKPRWFIWENVPGVLSSWSGDTPDSLGISPGQGRTMDLEETSDFASIIGAFSELGYGVAGRVLDAQYFGVPQRRRRVFVVGYLGDWRRAAEALFEFGCVSGDLATGGKKRKDVAGTLASRTSAGGGLGTDFDLDGGLQPCAFQQHGSDVGRMGCLRKGHGDVQSGVPFLTSPLTTRPYADQASDESKLIAYQCQGTNVGPMGTFRAGNGNETGGVPFIATSTGDKAHCLNAGGMGRQDYETETMVVAFDTTQITSKDNVSNPKYGDACHPIPAHGHVPAIAVSSFRTAGDGAVYDSGNKTAALTTATDPCANIIAFSSKDHGADAGPLSPTLRAMNHTGSHANAGGQVAIAFSGRERGDDGRGYGREPNVTGDITETVDATKPPRVAGPSIGVRRLTPIECERLQGFPDNYTNVIHRGKPAADGPRYKSLGNSMAVVVMEHLGEQIDMVEAQIKAESIKST